MKNVLLETKVGDMTQDFKIMQTFLPDETTVKDIEGNEHIVSVAEAIKQKEWETAWSLAKSMPVSEELCRIATTMKETGNVLHYLQIKDKDGKPLKQVSEQTYKDIFIDITDVSKFTSLITKAAGNEKLVKEKVIPLNLDRVELVDNWQDATTFEISVAKDLFSEINRNFRKFKVSGTKLELKPFESKSSIKSCRQWIVVEYLQDLNKTGPNVHDGNKGGAEGHWGVDFASRVSRDVLLFLCEQVDELKFSATLKLLFTLFVKFVNKGIYLSVIEWKRACNMFTSSGSFDLTDILLPTTNLKTNIIYVKDLYKNNDQLKIAEFYVDSLRGDYSSSFSIDDFLERVCADNHVSTKSEEGLKLKAKVIRGFICEDSNIQGFINYYTSGKANAAISNERSKQKAAQQKVLNAFNNQQVEKPTEPQQTTQNVKDVNPDNLNPGVKQHYMNDGYEKGNNKILLNEAGDEIIKSVDELTGFGGIQGIPSDTKIRLWPKIQDLASQVVNIKKFVGKGGKEDSTDNLFGKKEYHDNTYKLNNDDHFVLQNVKKTDPATADKIDLSKKELENTLLNGKLPKEAVRPVFKKIITDVEKELKDKGI